MIHIGLFSGIGGFELAASWKGWNTIVTCEINDFCNTVLNYYFPDAYHHGDIKTLTYDTINIELSKRFGKGWRNEPIILTGGFPCQPYSISGKREGKEDPRHLWPEMLRTIREIQPMFVVGENVYGLVNWNGGMVFNQVQVDLENEGYQVQPVILPACAIDAPHKRERVWFVAYNTNSGIEGMQQWKNRFYENRFTSNTNITPTRNTIQTGRNLPTSKIITDTEKTKLKQSRNTRTGRNGFTDLHNDKYVTDTRCSIRKNRIYGKESERKAGEFRNGNSEQDRWSNFPTQSPICSRNDGISSKLVGITFSKHRNESIKGYGNAIVPELAYIIYDAIDQFCKKLQEARESFKNNEK